jgi:tetratricopeptide (TPR) repeat protein
MACPVDQSLLTDTQQKEYSKLCTVVMRMRQRVEKEEEIRKVKPKTYVQQRAEKSLKYHETLLADIEAEFLRKKQQYETAIEHARQILESEPPSLISARFNLKQAIEEQEKYAKQAGVVINQESKPSFTQEELDEIAEMNRRQLEERKKQSRRPIVKQETPPAHPTVTPIQEETPEPEVYSSYIQPQERPEAPRIIQSTKKMIKMTNRR